MYKMGAEITIAGAKIERVESVAIRRSVENLCDTATIVIPTVVYNRLIKYGTGIEYGAEVIIELGYDNDLYREFTGYVLRAKNTKGTMEVECEDSLFLFRCEMDNMELKPARLRNILDMCTAAVKRDTGRVIAVACDYDFVYDKFVTYATTAYEVLKKIQQEAKPDIYLKGDVLHVHPCYKEIFGEARYDFTRNIERDGCDLVWRDIYDRRVKVEVTAKDTTGCVLTYVFGSKGGDMVSVKLPFVTDMKTLEVRAKETYNRMVYTGYEGRFTGWLLPFCDAGYVAELTDETGEYTAGRYYVTAVEVDYSAAGGKRRVTLGKRIG